MQYAFSFVWFDCRSSKDNYSTCMLLTCHGLRTENHLNSELISSMKHTVDLPTSASATNTRSRLRVWQFQSARPERAGGSVNSEMHDSKILVLNVMRMATRALTSIEWHHDIPAVVVTLHVQYFVNISFVAICVVRLRGNGIFVMFICWLTMTRTRVQILPIPMWIYIYDWSCVPMLSCSNDRVSLCTNRMRSYVKE